MLQPRHRPDKENQVHRLPKTPGPGKSIISKNPLKTPFHDENHTQKFHQTGKKSVVFGQSANQPDPSKLNVFQTPAPRRILGGKDLNTRQTPFHAPPSTIKPFNNAQGGDTWSPPFTKPTHRRHSRKSSLGLRISPVKDVLSVGVDEAADIEYMPPAPKDIPFEPADWEPIDWDLFSGMKQNVAEYFVKVDESGKSEMDYFVERPMDFGKEEELPVCPEPPKVRNSGLARNGGTAKRWVAPKSKSLSSVRDRQATSKSNVRTGTTPLVRPTRRTITSTRPKAERFLREDLQDEVSALEKEELALCRDDDFGMTFDLEL